MTIILIIGFFMSLFLFLLLLGKRNKNMADKILLGMFAVYALTIGGTYAEVYNRVNDYPYPHLMNFSWLFLLLHGPMLWFYIKSLTDGHFKLKEIQLLHFTPFLVYSIVHYFNFLSLPAEAKLFYLNQPEVSSMAAKIGSIIIGVSTISYNIIALFLLRKHRQNIENRFSTIEEIDLNWLRVFAVASLVIFSVNVLLFNINNYIQLTDYDTLSQIAYSFSTLYVLYIGYFGIKQGRIFSDGVVVDTTPTEESIQPDLSKQKALPDLVSRLTEVMEHQRPWLEPELTISRLSNLLNVKPEALSEVLNRYMNQNFFDYVNRYRIDDFKIRFMDKSNQHLSIIGMAYECGFNSKAAFYRAFNKFEGMTPTAWSARVSLKNETPFA
jgi:AraC-like DNA-binding protein